MWQKISLGREGHKGSLYYFSLLLHMFKDLHNNNNFKNLTITTKPLTLLSAQFFCKLKIAQKKYLINFKGEH